MALRLLTLPVRSAKGRMHIVTAQGIKISYNLPFVELLPLSVPFFYRSVNIWNSLCLKSRNSESLSNFKNNVRRELLSI